MPGPGGPGRAAAAALPGHGGSLRAAPPPSPRNYLGRPRMHFPGTVTVLRQRCHGNRGAGPGPPSLRGAAGAEPAPNRARCPGVGTAFPERLGWAVGRDAS